jgi:hypothetical protein
MVNTLPSPSKPFVIVATSVAAVFLVWNILATLGGWSQGWLRIALDGGAILVVLVRFRYSRVLFKIWSILPIVSLGVFLVSSALRGRWGIDPLQHLVGAALTLPLFLWADQAYRPGNLTFVGADREPLP